MRPNSFIVLLTWIAAMPALAELPIESTSATHPGGLEYRFPMVGGGSASASRINTFLQAVELKKLPGRYNKVAFEEIWPQGEDEYGTIGIDYRVRTNARGLFAVTIDVETMAAYPSSAQRTYNFDARSGEVITLDTVFTADGRDAVRDEIGKRRVRAVDDFLAGKAVQIQPGSDSVTLSDDPETAQEQKDLYAECRDGIAKDDLDWNDLVLMDDGLTLAREPCAPHVLRAIDELGSLDVALGYGDLRAWLNSYGQCLLVERRADCPRVHEAIGAGVYRGTIGKRYPITLVVGAPPFAVAADAIYFYDKYATAIELRAARGEDGVLRLDESGPPPARFELKRVASDLVGEWSQEGKPPLAVELR